MLFSALAALLDDWGVVAALNARPLRWLDAFALYSRWLAPAYAPCSADAPDAGAPWLLVRAGAPVRYLFGADTYTACELYDSLRFLAFTLGVQALAWPLAEWTLRRSMAAFASIEPQHKQRYVVANVSKAAMLATLASSPFWISGIVRAYVFDQWRHEDVTTVLMIKRACCFYVSTDIAAMFFVPSLPATTRQHHIVAGVLALVIAASNFATADVVKMIALYGSWSTVAWPVNAYLAARVVWGPRRARRVRRAGDGVKTLRVGDGDGDGESEETTDDSSAGEDDSDADTSTSTSTSTSTATSTLTAARGEANTERWRAARARVEAARRNALWLDVLAQAALITYVVACAGNWTWHAVWLVRSAAAGELSVAMAAYCVCVAQLARDDIILMRFLAARCSPKLASLPYNVDVFIKKKVVVVRDNAVSFSQAVRRRTAAATAASRRDSSP